jgi:hypothetical protein
MNNKEEEHVEIDAIIFLAVALSLPFLAFGIILALIYMFS